MNKHTKLTVWQILALSEAVRAYGGFEKESQDKLIALLDAAIEIKVTTRSESGTWQSKLAKTA